MPRWYYAGSGFFLLQATGAFAIVDYWIYGSWEGKTGDKITQSLNLLQIVMSLLLFTRAYRKRGRVAAGGILAIVMASFLLLSTLWSIDPQTTIRRGVIYLFFVIGTIGIAGNLDGDDFMELLGVTCLLSAIASLLLLTFSPDASLMGDELRGIFSHKNVLGEVMATGALASLHGLRVGRKRWRKTVMLILFTAVAMASRSATSIMTIFVYCCISAITSFIRKGGVARIMTIISIMLLLPAVVVAAAFPDSLLELIGKDPTLTGRTDLWALVLTYIAQRPLLGWGYSAFWSPINIDANEISTVLGWSVPEAHNGVLEMLLEVGFVGTAVFLVLWVRNLVLSLCCIFTPAKELAITSLLCCVGIFLVGVTEQVLVDPSFGSVSVFFVTGLMSERAVRVARQKRTSRRSRWMVGSFETLRLR